MRFTKIRRVIPALVLTAVVFGVSNAGRAAGPITIEGALVILINQVEVPAEQAGQLKEVLVTEGQLVKAGELLARISDEEAKLDEQQAEIQLQIATRQANNAAAIRAAEEAVRVAEANFRRAEASQAAFDRSVTDSEMDGYVLEKFLAAARLEEHQRARAVALLAEKLRLKERDVAALSVQRHQIKSPLPGMVVRIDREPGEWVTPGAPVLRVIRLDRLRVTAFVPAELGTQQLSGAAAKLHVGESAARQTFEGRVRFVSPEVESESKMVRVSVELDNPDNRLRPGERGTLVISPQ